jgi:chromosome segregation ATPase
MEPIQDDIETVRDQLRVNRDGWSNEHKKAVDAEAALDRLVAERDALQAQVEGLRENLGWMNTALAEETTRAVKLEAERDRLIQGIGALVEKCRFRASGPIADPSDAAEKAAFWEVVLELEALTKTTEEAR